MNIFLHSLLYRKAVFSFLFHVLEMASEKYFADCCCYIVCFDRILIIWIILFFLHYLIHFALTGGFKFSNNKLVLFPPPVGFWIKIFEYDVIRTSLYMYVSHSSYPPPLSKMEKTKNIHDHHSRNVLPNYFC